MRKLISMDETQRSKKSLSKKARDLQNIVLIADPILQGISLWNPAVGIILNTFVSTIRIGVNESSETKAQERCNLVLQTIENIKKKQASEETNFEAALICPDLFRSAMIFTDTNRAKEHLRLIEKLFSAGRIEFDPLSEALRLVSQLTDNEYKLLKLIPEHNTKWKDLLSIKEIAEKRIQDEHVLKASLLSLINMNLIVRKLEIQMNGGPELGDINFDKELEYVRLSDYGIEFINTIRSLGDDDFKT